jgi:hypothetical protein
MGQKPGEKAHLETPMEGHPAVKGLSSAPGKYSSHPELGPPGVDGGMPLKFYDDSIKGKLQETDNPMFVTPMAHATTGKTAAPASEPYPGRGFPFKEK